MSVIRINPRKEMSKSKLMQIIIDQRDTIEALKSALAKRRNPNASVLQRATVEELMIELESRDHREVKAYVDANMPTHDDLCADRERRFPGTGCTCKGKIPERAQVIEIPRGRLQ